MVGALSPSAAVLAGGGGFLHHAALGVKESQHIGEGSLSCVWSEGLPFIGERERERERERQGQRQEVQEFCETHYAIMGPWEKGLWPCTQVQRQEP